MNERVPQLWHTRCRGFAAALQFLQTRTSRYRHSREGRTAFGPRRSFKRQSIRSGECRYERVRLTGAISRVRYRDGLFAVVTVESDTGRVTASGQMAAACPGMPVDAEVEERSGPLDRHYGESVKLVSQRDPGPAWKASSGVYAWLRAGAAGCAAVADRLCLAFGSRLADTVFEHPERCVEEVEGALSLPDRAGVGRALGRLSLPAKAAADLGVRDADWLAGRLTVRYGDFGPLVAFHEAGQLVGEGALPLSAAAAFVDDLVTLVAGALDWQCRTSGTDVVRAAVLRKAVKDATGASVEAVKKAVAQAVEEALVGAVDDWLVPARVLGAAARILARVEKPQDALSVDQALEERVCVVSVGADADLAPFFAKLEELRRAGRNVRIAAADARGPLLPASSWPRGVPSYDTTGLDCDTLVLLDAHRLDWDAHARLLDDAALRRTAVVLVGCPDLWAPGSGDRAFADLVESGLAPTVRYSPRSSPRRDVLDGMAPADSPQVVVGAPDHRVLRVWEKGPTSVATSEDRDVVLRVAHRSLGAGAVGKVSGRPADRAVPVFVDSPGLRDQGSLLVPEWKLSGDVQRGWASGVRTGSLVVASKLDRRAWHAVLCAAEKVWVPKWAAEPLAPPGSPAPSVLLSLAPSARSRDRA
jgi:hypothetical protein